ncbi:MAG: hypothetical protein ACRC2P_01475, partial [Eubacterium aggregans]
LFKGVISKTLMVATWTGGWQFPWKFPFKFKDKGEPSITINNLGHCDTPVEIFFKGPAYNPKITLDTGEFIKVKKTVPCFICALVKTQSTTKQRMSWHRRVAILNTMSAILGLKKEELWQLHQAIGMVVDVPERPNGTDITMLS